MKYRCICGVHQNEEDQLAPCWDKYECIHCGYYAYPIDDEPVGPSESVDWMEDLKNSS